MSMQQQREINELRSRVRKMEEKVEALAKRMDEQAVKRGRPPKNREAA